MSYLTGAESGERGVTAVDYADLDSNGVTDDVCIWWECVAGACNAATKMQPSDMGGTFVVDILHDESAQNQTFLVGATQTDKIEVAATTPAVIAIALGRTGK